MVPYDTVNLVAAASRDPGAVGGAAAARARPRCVVTGANGDERGFTTGNREGVSPDDMYVTQFPGFVFAPVTDDRLSTDLPAVRQTA